MSTGLVTGPTGGQVGTYRRSGVVCTMVYSADAGSGLPCREVAERGDRGIGAVDDVAEESTGGTRTGPQPASDDELNTRIHRYVKAIFLFCWAHEITSVTQVRSRPSRFAVFSDASAFRKSSRSVTFDGVRGR